VSGEKYQTMKYRDIIVLKYVSGEPDAAYLKEYLTDEQFINVDRGKRSNRKFKKETELVILQNGPLSVPVKKTKDLLELPN
jgi:hypothetical protein